jgi:hypothetical protein
MPTPYQYRTLTTILSIKLSKLLNMVPSDSNHIIGSVFRRLLKETMQESVSKEIEF